MNEIFRSAIEAAAAVRHRVISPVELLNLHVAQIHAHNKSINALVTVEEEAALDEAKLLADEVTRGQLRGPLHGLPIAIKDLYDFKAGVRNTFGSVEFRDFVPDVTATYVARLESAGAVVLGKGNVSEFGHKAVTDNALFGATSTPFNVKMNAGGSSGGCASAVAAGLVAMAQGSDAGGSIRIPAAFCGVVGLMPTSGAVAQRTRPDGYVANALSVQSGPICRTVEDTAVMLGVMAGPSVGDPLSFHMPWASRELRDSAKNGDVSGLRVGLLNQIGDVKAEDGLVTAVRDGAEQLELAGAVVEDVSLDFGLPGAELYELWERHYRLLYRSLLHGFREQGIDLLRSEAAIEPSFRHELEEATKLTLEQRIADQVLRTSVFETMSDAFGAFDVLLSPTVAVQAIHNSRTGPTFGPSAVAGDLVNSVAGWAYTFVTNLTGFPAASVPCGRGNSGVPIGMQIIGGRFGEPTVLRVAAALERARPWSYDIG